MWASTQAGWQVGERASGQACRQAGERVNKRGRSSATHDMATDMKPQGQHGTHGKRSRHEESPTLGKSQAKITRGKLKQDGNWNKMEIGTR